MINLTGQYALRGLIFLAQHADEWPIPGNRIAEAAEMPAKYLSTIFSELVRVGLLEATRGKGGGFRMVRPPHQTFLYDVLAPFEHFEDNNCPFGNTQCTDDNPCGAHQHWKVLKESYLRFLHSTSVEDIAARPGDADLQTIGNPEKESPSR